MSTCLTEESAETLVMAGKQLLNTVCQKAAMSAGSSRAAQLPDSTLARTSVKKLRWLELSSCQDFPDIDHLNMHLKHWLVSGLRWY